MMQSRGRVLLVEDEDVLATTTAELLRRRGHECVIARTLDEARRQLEDIDGRFDLVITDIHLPGGTDLEVLDMLPPGAATPPVIVITGYPSTENALRAVEHHVFAYRVKPFDMEEFLDTVDRAVAQGQFTTRVAGSRLRFAEIAAQLEVLRQRRPARTGQDLDQHLIDYVLLLLTNNAESLAEAIDVLRLADRDRLGSPVRQLSRHPDAELFRNAVTHTVQVLESTRRSFKSRELAELRQQLEAALAAAGQNPGAPGDK
jgi:DNA-binding response OmpR family regulator